LKGRRVRPDSARRLAAAARTGDFIIPIIIASGSAQMSKKQNVGDTLDEFGQEQVQIAPKRSLWPVGLATVGFFGTMGFLIARSKSSNNTVRFGTSRVATQAMFVAALCGYGVYHSLTSRKEKRDDDD